MVRGVADLRGDSADKAAHAEEAADNLHGNDGLAEEEYCKDRDQEALHEAVGGDDGGAPDTLQGGVCAERPRGSHPRGPNNK